MPRLTPPRGVIVSAPTAHGMGRSFPGPSTSGIGGRRDGRMGETFVAGDLSVPLANPPQDFAMSLETIAPNVTSLVEQNRTPDETWYDALIRLLPAIAATQQQRELLKVQTDRAKAGLPPLDTADYGLGVKVGLSADTKQLLIYGGAALIALIAFGVIRIGRR